ncbi:MAG: hypothetical protein LAT64_03720 [Phycisphaerales bacterium]|nr:hypothetical protein [Planctomycetota bacterium]MCH8507859.1 hypothetical protein [Phycisphaerales bacterium]
MNHRDPNHPASDEAALRAIAERLDALGEAEASGASPRLETSILDAVSETYQPGPIPMDRAATPWWRSAPLRAAAVTALLGSVAALIYTSPGPPPPSAEVVSVALAEDRIEGLLAMLGDRDDFAEQLASLELWADALGSENASAWIGSDLGDPEIGGGIF